MSEILTPKTEEIGTGPGASGKDGAEMRPRPLTPEEWAAHVARVREAQGKFAHMFSSVEEFNRRKQEEIDMEEEQSRRRMKGEDR